MANAVAAQPVTVSSPFLPDNPDYKDYLDPIQFCLKVELLLVGQPLSSDLDFQTGSRQKYSSDLSVAFLLVKLQPIFNIRR